MRRALSLIFASALVMGGAYLLYLQVFVSLVIYGLALAAAAAMLVGGIAWLWADFIGPVFRKQDVA